MARPCPKCGSPLSFNAIAVKQWRLKVTGVHFEGTCKGCGGLVSGTSAFVLVAVCAATLFLLVQLRVIDARPVYALLGVREHVGEALLFVSLLAVLGIAAARIR